MYTELILSIEANIAQLVELCIHTAVVVGSSPIISKFNLYKSCICVILNSSYN